MRHRDMHSQPGYLIRRLHQRSTAHFATATSGLNITQIQLSILLVLRDRPGIDATSISDLIGSDRTTIRQALLVMEKRSLIRRVAHASDRRMKRLEITGAGENIAEQASALVIDLGDAILRGLSSSENKLFRQLLAKLIQHEQ